MMHNTLANIRSFLNLACTSKGQVWAQAESGKCYDLKNEESQCIVAAEMLQHGDKALEFFASDLNTQMRFVQFLGQSFFSWD